jgi:hypothetical protein
MLRDVQVDGVCLQGDLASNATLREKYLTLYGKKFQWVKYCERFNQAVTYSTRILATIRQECYNLNRIALSGLADGGRVTIHWSGYYGVHCGQRSQLNGMVRTSSL